MLIQADHLFASLLYFEARVCTDKHIKQAEVNCKQRRWLVGHDCDCLGCDYSVARKRRILN